MKYFLTLLTACICSFAVGQEVSATESQEKSAIATSATVADSPKQSDLVVLHLYRKGGAGFALVYKVHLDDTVLWESVAKTKATFKLKKTGSHVLWAKTEAREELPITLEPGREYYVRCGVTIGAFAGHPSLTLVDEKEGRKEFGEIKGNPRDIVYLKNGKRIECMIKREDNDNVYCTILRNDKQLDTHIAKSTIESIERRE
ncbi:hypothetical protein WBG78_16400 [Chryseolinea sp. T2]|uniref:hypothetical protein n=1 Tax=Chryseolinea sp. T2 TaxID=3129255 RepID=UPI0030778A48